MNYNYNKVNYGSIENLNKHLLYKRIVEWAKDKLVLEDGTLVTIETSEKDCCAGAWGRFSNVELQAVITNVEIGEVVDIPDSDTNVRQVRIFLYHNQNPIAQAEIEANAGNGGYYFAVGSLVVDGIHFPVVDVE